VVSLMAGTSDATHLFVSRVEAHLAMARRLPREAAAVSEAAAAITRALQAGGQVLLFGNGGSAADAQHLAAEFVGRLRVDRPGLAAVALTADSAILTAIGNDYSFEAVFSRQVEAIGRRGDVAIGITTSGRSRNVVEGLRAARRQGLVAIALTGEGGGQVRSEADLCISIPAPDTQRVQEGYMLVGHVLCELVEARFVEPRHGAHPSQPAAASSLTSA
jgi:D-sedoheptulose 7-phosphate isomerase